MTQKNYMRLSYFIKHISDRLTYSKANSSQFTWYLARLPWSDGGSAFFRSEKNHFTAILYQHLEWHPSKLTFSAWGPHIRVFGEVRILAGHRDRWSQRPLDCC